MNTTSNSSTEIIDALRKSQKPILCIDGRMDMDAYCSALAVYNIVKIISGKRVALFSGHTVLSDYYLRIVKAFGIDLSIIKMSTDPITIDFSKYDLQIFIDSGNIEHISQNADFKPDSKIEKLNIDHHSSNNLYGNYNYVKDYSSACSVLYEILKDQNIIIEEYTAKLLLIGILCDSNFLRNSNVNSKEYLFVADLIKISGVQPYRLNEIMMVSSIEDTKIRKIVFKNLNINKRAKYAYSYGTIEDYQAENLMADYKGLPPVDVIKSIENLDFVFFVRQDIDKYNISFRSVNMDYNVLKFAEKLNGGGHKVAAAGTLKTNSINEAVSNVLEIINTSQ